MEKITDDDLRLMLTKPDSIVTEESNTKDNWNEIPLDDTFEEIEDIDFNKIPDNVDNTYEEKPLNPILEKRGDISLGLSVEDLKDLCNYMAGSGEKPLFIDKFMADTEGRLREMTSVMTLYQLQQIPILTQLRNQVMERLFDPANLYDMDSKTLSATLTNLNKDIMNILDVSIKNVQTTAQFSSLSNEYRNLLDGFIMLPPDKLKQVKETVLGNNSDIDA